MSSPTPATSTFNISLNTWRWMGFSLLAAAYVLVFFHRMAAGVVSADLMQSFNISAAALGSLAASYYYIYTAMQIPSGVIADTIGPRWSVGISGLLAAGGAILFALAPDFATATIGRLIVGMCLAFVFVGLMKYNSVWFPPHRYGTISGITLFIGNLGAIAATLPLATLLEYSDIGWRNTFLYIGIAGGVLSLLTMLCLRDHPRRVLVSLPPEQLEQPSVDQSKSVPASAGQESVNWRQALWGTVTNLQLWPGFMMQFGTTGAVFAFAGLWVTRMMTDLHELTTQDAAYYAMAIMLGLALGSLSSGTISDRVGRRKPFMVGYAFLALLVWIALLMGFGSVGWSGYTLFFLLGFAAGGIAVVYAMARELADPRYAGMAIAIVNMGLFLGAALAQPLFGVAMELTWDGTVINEVSRYQWRDYQLGLWLSVGFAAIGVVAAVLSKETYCRNLAEPIRN